MCYDVPRSTHTYLVEHLLAVDFLLIKTELIARYVNFHVSLSKSRSDEVQFLTKVVCNDARSTTSKNLALIQLEAGLNPLSVTSHQVREAVKVADIPVNQGWRLELLKNLLDRRRDMENMLENTDEISKMIESLCSS